VVVQQNQVSDHLYLFYLFIYLFIYITTFNLLRHHFNV